MDVSCTIGTLRTSLSRLVSNRRMGAVLSVAAATESSRRAEDGASPLLPRDLAGTDDMTGVSQTGGGVTGAGGTVADGATAADPAAPVAGATTGAKSGTTAKTGSTADSKTGTKAGATTDTKAGTAGAAPDAAKAGTAGAAPGTDPEPEETDDWENWSLCGLDDDDEDMEEWTPEERIKTSQLTPQEKEKFEAIVAQCFSYDTLCGKRIVFDCDDVMEVLTKVIPYLESEPMLIEDVPFGAMIVGDLHGHLHDLHRCFHFNTTDDKPGWYNGKYVFLGDYVDRGRQSLEIIMALFCLKMLRPDDIFLLRGNHEFILVNVRYGLVSEINRRYIDWIAEMIYFQINETFGYLSVAAIMGGKYLCCHGGISMEAYTRRDLRGIPKPIVESGEDVVLHDIVWTDPGEGLKGGTFCNGRGTGFYYGFDALAYALASMDVTAVFRGHSVLNDGYCNNWNCCFTIFSSVCMGGGKNKGSVAVVDEAGDVTVHILEVDEKRREWEKELMAKEGIREDGPNDLTTHDDGTGVIPRFS